MNGLRDALEQSQKDRVAIGHFNVDWVLLKAVSAEGAGDSRCVRG
jgi:fructose-bisphosphate aldolase, class II